MADAACAERTVSVSPVPAAWMESTAARRSRLFWKSFTRAWRVFVLTLPSMRMYLVFVLHACAITVMPNNLSGCSIMTCTGVCLDAAIDAHILGVCPVWMGNDS